MPLPPNDTHIDSIVERVRTVVQRAQRSSLEATAEALALPVDAFRALIVDPSRPVDAAFLIDAISALVHEWAIDPCWLLTGRYSPSLHREVLAMGEDRTSLGILTIRRFVYEQYRKLLAQPLALLWSHWSTRSSAFRTP